MFLRLYEQPLWRVPRPRVVSDRARWDMVEVEYWLDTLSLVQPPGFDHWLAINSHRVAPYTVGWRLLELLRPRAGGTHPLPAVPRLPESCRPVQKAPPIPACPSARRLPGRTSAVRHAPGG